MNELPKLKNVKNKTKKYIYSFGGINRSEYYVTGELETSENISFDSYPAISAGRGRESAESIFSSSYDYLPAGGGVVTLKYTEVTGLNIAYIEEKEDPGRVSSWDFADKEPGKRAAASLGKNVVLFPDKMCCDIVHDPRFEDIEKTLDIEDGDARILAEGAIRFLDTAKYTDFKSLFKVGDVISILGGWWDGNETGGVIDDEAKFIIRELDKDNYTVRFDPNCFDVGEGSGYVMFETTFKKTAPDLINVCGYDGRVWGYDEDGIIYASKYQDPTNFEYFDSSSADSYTLETETTGAFTAICGAEGHIAFFKEDKIHRITGTKPSNFRHTVIYTNGVKKGAEKTVCLKNGLIYYMGTDGIYVYGGAEAERISDGLGDLDFADGAAVFYKDVYYISIKSSDGSTSLYAYDTGKGIWIKDGDEYFKTAFTFLSKPHFQKENGEVKIFADGIDETRKASFTLRALSENDSEQKGWSRIFVNVKLKKGDTLKVEADYGFGFEPCGVFTDFKKQVFEIRLAPRRADEIKLRLTFGPGSAVKKLMREYFVHGSVF